jgi:hypothetical protein
MRLVLVVDEALLSAQRAYVCLREFRTNIVKNPLNEEIQTCTIQPIWENTGATPTRGGRSHGRGDVLRVAQCDFRDGFFRRWVDDGAAGSDPVNAAYDPR